MTFKQKVIKELGEKGYKALDKDTKRDIDNIDKIRRVSEKAKVSFAETLMSSKYGL